MAGVIEGLRTKEFTTSSGKDVKETKMLSGEAKMTSAFKESNSTKQYSCPAPPQKDLGGMNLNR